MRKLLIFTLTQIALAAVSNISWAIPQNQMDQLRSFFCGAQTASGGVLIGIGQISTSPTVQQREFAQMISVCQVDRQHQKFGDLTTINGSGCPIGYFNEVSLHPQPDGSVVASTVERNVLSSVTAKVLTGLSQYSTSTTATTITNSATGAFTTQATSQRRYVEADGSTVVTVQVGSDYSGITTNNNGIITQSVSSDKEDYTISFAGQIYTAESLLNGTQTTCTIGGASSSCNDFSYIMCTN